MGIDDDGRIEKYLAGTVCPRAFYFALPANFNARLVHLDQTALTCAAFLSPSVRTGNDLQERLGVTIARLFQSEYGVASDASVVERDSDDGCTSAMRLNAPRSVPSLDDIVKANDDQNGSPYSAVKLSPDARIRIARDDGRYTPSIRALQHDKRYSGRRKPMDDEELAALKGRIFGSHPLIGYRFSGNKTTNGQDNVNELEALAEFSDVRRKGYGHRDIRRAVQAYLPVAYAATIVRDDVPCSLGTHDANVVAATNSLLKWKKRHADYEYLIVMMRRLARYTKEGAAGTKVEETQAEIDAILNGTAVMDVVDLTNLEETETPTTESPPAMGERRLIIDGVALDFDVDTYVRSTIDVIPDSFYKKTRKSERTLTLLPSQGRVHHVEQSPLIGECDLKIVHDILRYSDSGDDVLIRNRDSDILHILLHNMHRFVGRDGKINRRIFLDVWFPSIKKSRLEQRYICLNRLYLGIISHGQRVWNLDTPELANSALAIITGAAVFCGSDYTSRIPRVGSAKIVPILEDDTIMRVIAREAVAYLPSDQVPDLPAHANTLHRPVLSVFTTNFVRVFAGQAVINTLPAPVRRNIVQQPLVFRHDWKLIRKLHDEHLKKNPRATFQVPDFDVVCAAWRRISWVLNYFANAPCGIGAFPSPLWQSDAETSLWGWARALPEFVSEKGVKRYIQLNSVPIIDAQPNMETKDGIIACHNHINKDDMEPLIAALAEYMVRSEALINSHGTSEILPHLEVECDTIFGSL